MRRKAAVFLNRSAALLDMSMNTVVFSHVCIAVLPRCVPVLSGKLNDYPDLHKEQSQHPK